MKVTLRDIYLARESFEKIFYDTQFDPIITYKWAKAEIAMNTELKAFHMARLKILKPFETEKGEYKIPSEEKDRVLQDIENLLQIEVEIPNFSLTLVQVSQVNGISTMDWVRLDPFIKGETE